MTVVRVAFAVVIVAFGCGGECDGIGYEFGDGVGDGVGDDVDHGVDDGVGDGVDGGGVRFCLIKER